jgi:hypothetical protein
MMGAKVVHSKWQRVRQAANVLVSHPLEFCLFTPRCFAFAPSRHLYGSEDYNESCTAAVIMVCITLLSTVLSHDPASRASSVFSSFSI